MEYYMTIKKNEIMLFFRKMNETRGHLVKQIKPDSGKQISLVSSCMWNLKQKTKNRDDVKVEGRY